MFPPQLALHRLRLIWLLLPLLCSSAAAGCKCCLMMFAAAVLKRKLQPHLLHSVQAAYVVQRVKRG
jgi:hypothetical protein